MLKILFIVPDSLNPKQIYLEYPLGVGYICTYLKRLGYQTKIIDQHAECISDECILEIVSDFQPNIVAFALMTPCYPRAKKQLNLIKSHYPDLPIIAGGVHATIFGERLFLDGFDAVILGEGETVLQELCLAYSKYGKFILSDKIKISPKFKVATLAHLNKKDFADICFDELILDRDVYNLKLYEHHSLSATRGCQYNCRFCCNYTKLFGARKKRTTESIIKEIILLEQKYNAKKIFFVDDIFLFNKENIINFCNKYQKNKLQSEWVAQLRVNTLDIDVARLIKQSGCKRVYYGVESGSQKILDAANKMITTEQIKSGIFIAKKAGLRVKTGWIVGLPGSFKEQLQSLDLMIETMPNDISIHQLIPFPGTDYYNNPEKYGITIRDKYDFESFCYGGLSNNFLFEYLSITQYHKILEIFIKRLESAGYISSDVASPGAEFVYTSPLSKKSLRVFQS